MLDLATETFALPIWAVAAMIALFAVAAVLAFIRTAASDVLPTLLRTGIVFVGVLFVVWIFLDRTAVQIRDAERHALEARVSELAVRAVTPSSPLACLDAIAGDAVETACEQALFAGPEVVASAVSYVSARLNLLARGLEFASRGDLAYGSALLALRQSLESDRFGIVAQVLSLRDSCTPAQCDTFALLHDTSRVRANLKDRTFDNYVARYSVNWSGREGRAGAPVADASGSTAYTGTTNSPASNGAVATASGVVPGQAIAVGQSARPAMATSRYDFPSASSIPAVSIMTPEPETSAARTPAVPSTAAISNAPTPQRKPAARAASTPPRTTQSVSAPVPLAPSSQPSTTGAGPSLQ